jgi:hypothetical protein
VIFNALIIVLLIPLALKGVRYRAVGAAALLRRNLLIYGLGGLIVPFIGIKAIDLLLVASVWSKRRNTHEKHSSPRIGPFRRADAGDRHRLSAGRHRRGAMPCFRHRPAGSLIIRDGKPVGSALIGQNFSDPKHFWGRPSATGPMPTTRGIQRLQPGPAEPGLDGCRQGLVSRPCVRPTRATRRRFRWTW